MPSAREDEFWQVGSVQSVFNSSRGKAYRKMLESSQPTAQ